MSYYPYPEKPIENEIALKKVLPQEVFNKLVKEQKTYYGYDVTIFVRFTTGETASFNIDLPKTTVVEFKQMVKNKTIAANIGCLVLSYCGGKLDDNLTMMQRKIRNGSTLQGIMSWSSN